MANRTIAAFLLILANVVPFAISQTMPATQPGLDPDLAKAHYPWMVLQYTAKGYRVHVTVNGVEYANFETGEGSDTKTTPLQAGKNEIVVDITRTAAADAKGETLG